MEGETVWALIIVKDAERKLNCSAIEWVVTLQYRVSKIKREAKRRLRNVVKWPGVFKEQGGLTLQI